MLEYRDVGSTVFMFLVRRGIDNYRILEVICVSCIINSEDYSTTSKSRGYHTDTERKQEGSEVTIISLVYDIVIRCIVISLAILVHACDCQTMGFGRKGSS